MMSRSRSTLLAAGALLCLAPSLLADSAEVTARAGLVRVGTALLTYSVEVPVLARVQGTAFFRSSVSISNNTTKNGVIARYQFSYTCFSSSCPTVGGFYRTQIRTITLQALETFHQDDFIDFLSQQSALVTGAVQGTIGSLLVTFDNLDTRVGWEGTVVARTYNRLNEADSTSGTVGFAYNASLFFESADRTLVGYARDTKTAPTIAGRLRSNVGIRNTDILSSNQRVTVDLTFYNTVTGQRVGNTQTFPNLEPGEVRQISDLWATAGIASTVNSVIVFADVRTPTSTSPTIEGYITIIDGQVSSGGVATQDAAFFEMKCADTNGCGN